jgi:hypothetical protein
MFSVDMSVGNPSGKDELAFGYMSLKVKGEV